jgi:thymidine kinase
MGQLNLILGCMFSSKSSKLLEYYYKYKLKYKCLLISYEKDTRYEGKNCVITHNKFSVKSKPLLNLDIFDEDYYKEANVILIDEGQFFPDLVTFAKKSVNQDNKIVIISGLNGDYKKKSIGHINELVSEADNIEFQKAICHFCKLPQDAIFSLRINCQSEKQILIGEKDIYVPVCRYHYNQKIKN